MQHNSYAKSATQPKEKYALSDFPEFTRFIDNKDMCKWFLIILKYGFYNRYHSEDDFITLLEIEFNKLADKREDDEYIDLVNGDYGLNERLRTLVEESEIAHIDEKTGEEYLESYYLSHFVDIVSEQFEDIQTYFSEHERNGYTNATFPKGQGNSRILWMGNTVDER